MVAVHPIALQQEAGATSASVDAVRAKLSSMLAAGQGSEAIETALEIIAGLSSKIEDLTCDISQLKKLLFGKKTEKVHPNQLSLLAAMVVAVAGRDEATTDTSLPEGQAGNSVQSRDDEDEEPKKRKRKKRTCRQPRKREPDKIIEVKIPEGERPCEFCGGDRVCIGHESTTVIEYHPPRFEVLRYDREKLACRPCEGVIDVAPAPQKLMDGSPAGIGLASDIVSRKYIDGMPLNRTRKAYERLGMSFSLQNINNLEEYAYEVYRPVIDLIKKEVRASDLVNLDDTGLKVRDPMVKGKLARGHLWVFVGKTFDPSGAIGALKTVISFVAAPTRAGATVQEFLGDSKAIRHGDGFEGNAAGLALMGFLGILVGCLMHARRYFFKAFDAGDPAAGLFISEFARIYRIEAKAKADKLTADQRLSLRKAESLPIMQAIYERCVALRKTDLPRLMREATGYFVNQWDRLVYPFLHDGRVEVDNGDAERAIRPVACGRRAWLFAGSPDAAHKIAGMFSLVQTAVAAGINPEWYLRELLSQLVGPRTRTEADLAELLPHRIAARNEGPE